MPIAADRQRYFWLAANDAVTATEPEPSTYTNSKVTPLIDLFDYMEKFREAINLIGTDANPANNRGDFIYISGWWLGLLGGTFARNRAFTGPGSGMGSKGPMVDDLDAFDIDPLGPELRLIDVLKEKARAGVDVRVLGWVSFSLLSTAPVPIPILGALINPIVANAIQQSDPGGLVSLNSQTLNSIKNLRAEPAIAKGGMLNVLSHSAGAIHIKGAVVGSKPDGAGKTKAIAFTGGLDMVEDRWAKLGHSHEAGWDDKPAVPRWHDVEAGIEGPAAQGYYNHFRDMWNENLRRDPKRFNFEGEKMPSYVPGTEAVPDRTIEPLLIPSGDPMLHHVQSLRTIPAFNYRWYNCLPENKPVSYAPDGIFEIRAAWKKSILGAQRYIYMEDQMYWGKEIMEWVNTAIRAQPNLRVILAMSGQGDPNDPAFNDSELLHESINVGLLGQGTATALTPAQANQIRVYRMWGNSIASNDTMEASVVTPINAGEMQIETDRVLEAGSVPISEDAMKGRGLYITDSIDFWEVTGNLALNPGDPLVLKLDPHGTSPVAGATLTFAGAFGLVVHAKVTLIDDKWAIIGSANIARRSLYSDWEHSVSFMDENETAIRNFRAALWAEHFQLIIPGPFMDIDEGISSWDADPAWRTTAFFTDVPVRLPGDMGPPFIQRVNLPLPNHPMTEETRTGMNEIRDIDSRQDWGGVCPPDA
jgi:phosphatidylserine/phosphatidylglycerophosphate/cardiolipin synthase-like enzyme